MSVKFTQTCPDHPLLPDALESQADNLTAAKELKSAQLVLQRLASQYPASEAGKRAVQLQKKK